MQEEGELGDTEREREQKKDIYI